MRSTAFLVPVALLSFAGCSRHGEAPVPEAINAPDRLEVLYAEQDAKFTDRDGLKEAIDDIASGEPRLHLYGLPHPYDREWISIMGERFGVRVQFIAGCEVSDSLVRFADAYNSRIEQYILEEFGTEAWSTSVEDAKALYASKKTKEAIQPPQPTTDSSAVSRG